jgi:hypothetical protein
VQRVEAQRFQITAQQNVGFAAVGVVDVHAKGLVPGEPEANEVEDYAHERGDATARADAAQRVVICELCNMKKCAKKITTDECRDQKHR